MTFEELRAAYRTAFARERSEAARLARAYAAKAKRERDRPRAAEADVLLGEVAAAEGRLDRAGAHYASAIAAFRRLGKAPQLFGAAISAVQTSARRGRGAETRRLLRLLDTSARDRIARAYAAMAGGSALAVLGDARRAEECFRTALRLLGRRARPDLAATARLHLGMCLGLRGAAREAMRLFDEAARIFAEAGQPASAEIARHNRGWAAGIAGDLVSACDDLRAAREAFAGRGDRRREALALLDEAEVLLRMGDGEGARGHARKAASALKRLHALPEAGRALLVAARAGGGPKPARAARDLFRSAGDESGAATASVLLGERLDTAEARLRGAGHWLDALDALVARAGSLAPAAGARLLARRAPRYPALLRRWIAPDLLLLRARGGNRTALLRRAVRAVEALRMAAPRVALRASVLTRHLRCYEELARALLARGRPADLREAFLVVDSARARTLRDEMEREAPALGEPSSVRACRLRLEELWKAMEHRAREGGALRGGAPALLREVQHAERDLLAAMRSAPTGSAAVATSIPAAPGLSFAVIGGEVMGFLSASGAVASWRCGPLAPVREASEAFAFQVNRRLHGGGDAESAQACLARLDALLSPGCPTLPPGPLCIVIDAPLGAIPFEALSFGRGRAVHYAPSVFAPRVRRGARGSLLVGIDDERLPEVRREIAAVGRRLRGARRISGAAATRDAILSGLARCDVVHLAGHAQARPDVPLLSALRASDGWIAAADLGALRMRGGLVVLSACRTGDPSLRWNGEALGGFPRALLASGARAIVASRWEVRDEVAHAWMREFYGGLGALGPGEALARAARLVRRRFPHPADWAAFLLIRRGMVEWR